MAALVIIPFPLWHFRSFKSFSHLCSLCKGYTLPQSSCGLLSRTTSLVFIHTILLQWPPLFRFFSSHKSKTSTAWWEISHFRLGLSGLTHHCHLFVIFDQLDYTSVLNVVQHWNHLHDSNSSACTWYGTGVVPAVVCVYMPELKPGYDVSHRVGTRPSNECEVACMWSI